MAKSVRPLLIALCLSIVGSTLFAGLKSDLSIQSNFSGLTYYGAFEKHVPVAIGSVTDRRSVADRRFLGKGPNGVYSLYTADPPEKYIHDALGETLRSLGLAAKEGEAPALSVDAEIWRSHAWVRMGGRALLRCEINVRFVIRDATNAKLGSVSVLGNSEIKGQIVTKARWIVLFEQTLYDTMEKFAMSQTLARALGPEVAASFKKSTAREPEARYHTAEIETTKFYGPTNVVATLPKVDLSQFDVVELRPFKLLETDFKGDVGAIERAVPGSVMDRLGGLYAGLFSAASFGEVRLGTPKEGARRLIIEGDLPEVSAGSSMKRVMIGFGAGHVSLDMNIRLLDGESGKELGKMEMQSLNWGAGWQTSLGELDDMIDRMAADLTYYLINQHKPDYKSSEEEAR